MLLIKKLKLQPHSEGGYFREIYKSKIVIPAKDLPPDFSDSRSAMTSGYYLLAGDDFSRFHRLKADELWHHYEGGPLIIYIINSSGELEKHILGMDLKSGENPSVLIEKKQWFAAELKDKDSFVLAGCTVVPGFEYEDLELADRATLIAYYPQHKDIIKRLTL